MQQLGVELFELHLVEFGWRAGELVEGETLNQLTGAGMVNVPVIAVPTSIGYGAKAASRFMSKPVFWKVLDGIIAAIMFTLAITLVFFKF